MRARVLRRACRFVLRGPTRPLEILRLIDTRGIDGQGLGVLGRHGQPREPVVLRGPGVQSLAFVGATIRHGGG